MKYFLVVGEASGDLHASNLMRAILQQDSSARFYFMGGPLMREVGGECVVRSEEMAYMGFIDVARNLSKIRAGAKKVQDKLLEVSPDVVICVDYAGFCFRYILPFVKRHLSQSKLVYYIPPKVWAWKKYRIKKLRTHTDLVLTIFPFEVDYFAKHNLPQAHYVGNPSMQSVEAYLQEPHELETLPKPYIALLCGSRQSEIKQNLPTMLRVAGRYPSFGRVIAAAPGVPESLYHQVMEGAGICATLVFNNTFSVVRSAQAALVTSGTATLETALLNTPQVVCYDVKAGSLANFVFKKFFTIPFISLVNLVAGREIVQELFGGLFREELVQEALAPLLHDTPERQEMLEGYKEVRTLLHSEAEPATVAAEYIINAIN
ncbi:MAG: lipid-A-disaccharide synthase [Porphyromonas sp.]|nr:lipid-A-disaccharide synthase [Porphyromonas sp.]